MKTKLFDRQMQDQIKLHMSEFVAEFPNLEELLLKWKANPGCKCSGELFNSLRQEHKKVNALLCKLLGEEFSLIYPGPLMEALVLEMPTVGDIQDKLTELRHAGIAIRNFNVCPAHDGGYILTCL